MKNIIALNHVSLLVKDTARALEFTRGCWDCSLTSHVRR